MLKLSLISTHEWDNEFRGVVNFYGKNMYESASDVIKKLRTVGIHPIASETWTKRPDYPPKENAKKGHMGEM